MKKKIYMFLVVLLMIAGLALSGFAYAPGDCSISTTALSTQGYVDMFVVNTTNDIRFVLTTPTSRTLYYPDVNYSHEFGSLKRIWLCDGTGWYYIQPQGRVNGVWEDCDTYFGANASLSLNKYLYPAPFVESKGTQGWNSFYNTIPNAATTISNGYNTDTEKAQRFLTWVGSNIDYDTTEAGLINDPDYEALYPWQGAEYAYIMGKGICHDKVALFVGLCRAKGIPAKGVVGWIPSGGGTGYHAWAKVQIAGNWIACDPTTGYFWNSIPSTWTETGEYTDCN